MSENLPTPVNRGQLVWPQLRRLLILQLKLYIDAFRDICLSALALGAVIIDLIQHNDGPDCYFEQIMRLGRRTERAINLFDQYDPATETGPGVDSILHDVEERWRK